MLRTFPLSAAVSAFACLLLSCISAPEAPTPTHVDRGAFSSCFVKVDWLTEWNAAKKGRFGLDNLSVHEEEPFGYFLRARYYQGGASPSASRRAGVKEGGGQFLGRLPKGPVDHLFLRYFVRFPVDFPFVKGGKLPGLYGGTQVSGGRIPDGTNGFSTRFMWRTEGQGEVYAYLPSSTRFGTSLGRGDFSFQRGRFQCIEQELILNTPGQADGIVRAFVDGELVHETRHLLLRTTPYLQIEGVFFSTFFGGGDPTWGPPNDTYVDFAAFRTSSRRVGCNPKDPE